MPDIHEDDMWQPRLVENAPTKYLAMVEALEADVRSGRVAPGERLPAQRLIAKALNVDLTTVTRAISEARRRGLVEAQAGRGTFIRAVSEGSSLSGPPPAWIDLSMNIPPQPPDVDFRKAISQGIAEVLGSPRGRMHLHYQESRGSEPDRSLAASWLAGWIEGPTPDRIVVACGAQSALFALCDILLGPTDLLLAGAMTYPGLKAIAAQKGVRLEPIVMDDFGIVPEAFEQACREKSPKAIYLIPAIDNPTTTTLPVGRRHRIAELAQQYGVSIIEDDPYSPLRPERIVSMAELASDITWHIRTLSKCATPALRVAYVLAPNAVLARRLTAVLRATVLMAPPLMSALASYWISDGTLDSISKAICTENVARQKVASTVLEGLDWAADPHGPHLWLTLPQPWRAADFVEHADQAGVSIVPSSAFAVKDHPTEAVRISLGVAPDRTALERGLTQLVSLMAQPPLSGKVVV